MAELKCEYPEGCRLDLWAKVIKAKNIQKQEKVLQEFFCIPDGPICTPGDQSEGCGVGGKVIQVDDIKVNVLEAREVLNFNKVKIFIDYEIILFIMVQPLDPMLEPFPFIWVIKNLHFEKTIELDQFDPPLTIEEFRNEIDQSEIILCNWSFDYEFKGFCEDPLSPCFPLLNNSNCPFPPTGTCIEMVVYVDIIDKLGKMHDIIVYGELDPEIDC